MSREGEAAMKTIVLIVLGLAFAALILAFSSAEAAMVRRIPDLTAITPAPVVAVATERTVKQRGSDTGNTDTAE